MSKDPRHCAPGLPGLSFTRWLVPAALALALSAPAAHAQAWDPAGIPFCNATGDQSGLRAVSDGRGGFIAAWIDWRTSPPAIYAQRVDSLGVPQWTANGVPVATGFTGVSELVVAPDGQDGILLAWIAERAVSRRNVYAQRVNGSGAAQWTANGVLVDETAADTLQSAPAIDGDGLGGAILAWVDARGADDDVYVQRLRSDGSRAWTAAGVLVDADADPQASPRVLGNGAGGAWAWWEDVEANTQTFFQRFDSTGAAQWTAGGETSSSTVSVQALGARVPGTDSLVVVWWDSGGGGRLEGTVLTPAGNFTVAGGSLLESTAGRPVGLVMQAAGTSLVVFAGATAIEGKLVSGAGASGGSAVTLASGQVLDATSNVTVVSDAAGGLYVVWSSVDVARARHLTAAATTDWAAPVTLTSGVVPAESHPVAVPGFDLLAGWVDGRGAGTTGDDLFMQRVSPSGVTGTYYRILATVAGGVGGFTEGGGRTWVREGDSLRVRFAGGGGASRVQVVQVGTTTFGPVPNYTFHGVTADSTLQVTFSSAAATQQLAAVAGAYRAFSVPFTIAPNTVASVFASLMPYDPVRWRLGHWEADDSTYLEPSGTLASIVPGAGYWFIGLRDTTLSFSGTPVSETQFNLAMLGGPVSGQGWTQFGSPFRFPVAVSQLRLSLGPDAPITDAANTYTDHQVLEWNPGTGAYAPVSLLLPGRAYWLWRQSAAAVTLRFPFEWNPVATGGLAPSLAGGGDWSIGVTARSGEREARLAFGAAPVAEGRWNGLSTHAPPAGPGAGLSLVARVSDWGADNGDYASVYRPDAESLRFEFDASAPAGLAEATLSFAFTDLPAGRTVLLSEPATGWARIVEAGASAPLVLSANARRLRLEVLAGAPVTPVSPRATALRALGPNPFRDATTLSFSLAQAGPLRWEVFDLAGRRVAAATRTLDAGEHAVTWDGRDDGGRQVSPGLYLVRWQAGGRSGTARLVRTD